jgi:hypothetical protein
MLGRWSTARFAAAEAALAAAGIAFEVVEVRPGPVTRARLHLAVAA